MFWKMLGWLLRQTAWMLADEESYRRFVIKIFLFFSEASETMSELVNLKLLLSDREATVPVNVNGITVPVKIRNLKLDPTARKINRKKQQGMFKGGKKLTIGNIMQPFDESENDEIEMFRLAVVDWKMSEADRLWLIPDHNLETNGVETTQTLKTADGKVAIKVTVGSSNTAANREHTHRENKRMLRNNEFDNPLPEENDQVDSQVSRLMRVVKDWNIGVDGVKTPVSEGHLAQIVRMADDFANNVLNDADDGALFALANTTPAPVMEKAKDEVYAATPDHITEMAHKSIAFRKAVVEAANELASFRAEEEEAADAAAK